MAIRIYEPRYRDSTVLVAQYRIPAGGDIKIRILQGARAGLYKARNEDIIESRIEYMTTKTGKKLGMRAIPLDKLIRIAD